MSAFVVEDITINQIVAGMALDDLPPSFRNQVEDKRALAEAMYALNLRAVRSRYDDADKAGMVPVTFVYHTVMPQAPIRRLKSLGCWLYQCSEGDVPETALYQAMEKYRDRLAYRIATASPEYEAAPWG